MMRIMCSTNRWWTQSKQNDPVKLCLTIYRYLHFCSLTRFPYVNNVFLYILWYTFTKESRLRCTYTQAMQRTRRVDWTMFQKRLVQVTGDADDVEIWNTWAVARRAHINKGTLADWVVEGCIARSALRKSYRLLGWYCRLYSRSRSGAFYRIEEHYLHALCMDWQPRFWRERR